MIILFLIFGLAIAGFQTIILRELLQLKRFPKWLMFLITPTIIIASNTFYDDQITAIVFFGSISSIFLLAIISIIFQNSDNHNPQRYKSYSEVVKDYKQTIYLNPLWGIIYQTYVVVIILVFIFIPKDMFDSENNYQIIENDLSLQVLSLFLFTGFSLIILLYQFLNKRSYYIPSIFTTRKIVSTPQEFRINKAITIATTIISFLIFIKFCYDQGVYHMLKNLLTTFNQSTVFSINTAILVFIIFNSIILLLNPQDVAKRNMYRITLLIRSAFIGIFISAAIITPLMILEDKLMYFNISSEILLFLGFNIVLLLNEISLFIKYRKRQLD